MLQIFKSIKRGFTFYIVFTAVLFSAGFSSKLFDIEKGMIFYDIKGGGKLTDDTNLSIAGHGKLRFKNRGVFALIEESYEVKTSGAIKSVENIKKCEKLEDRQRLDVDFKKKKILERKLPKGNLRNYITKGLEKKGKKTISGYVCDMWEGDGVKKCLYKGVPLLIEYNVLGISYQKKASSVKLNIDTSASSKCSVPHYPVENFSIFKSNIKSKKLPQELFNILKTVTKEMKHQLGTVHIKEDSLNKKQKQNWLNKIGENIFQKQKLFLPQFLLSLKNTRICLYQADNWIEANQCIKGSRSLDMQFPYNEKYSIERWNSKEKNSVLTDFDNKISFLEPKMKCIRGSKNITDLSKCMK